MSKQISITKAVNFYLEIQSYTKSQNLYVKTHDLHLVTNVLPMPTIYFQSAGDQVLHFKNIYQTSSIFYEYILHGLH